MTKEDFEFIAGIFANVASSPHGEIRDTDIFAEHFADKLAGKFPLFKRDLFLKAAKRKERTHE